MRGTAHANQANSTLGYAVKSTSPAYAPPAPTACVQPRDLPTLNLHSNLLDNIQERARHLEKRLYDFGHRTLGSQPGEDGCGNEPSVPDGILELTRRQIDGVGQIIEACHSLMSRIEQIA